MPRTSLKLRLAILLLLPLLIVSLLAIAWRYQQAKETGENLFDQNLIALTLAVSRDITISGGDTLSLTTRDMMGNLSGGQLFYHVRGPDGAFVTGYAYPPLPQDTKSDEGSIFVYDTEHQGIEVRAAQLREASVFDDLRGEMVTTVWQSTKARAEFVFAQAQRATILTAVLFFTVAILIAFGIQFGLKPLQDLEDAIALRSPEDLRPIARRTPTEVQGIVARLNGLFREVSTANLARDRLISNAAHQLRNPIAAIGSLADAAKNSKSYDEKDALVQELAESTRHATRLSNQLLSLETVKARSAGTIVTSHDLENTLETTARRIAPRVINRGIEFVYVGFDRSVELVHDPILVGEAIENLVDNALRHGGGALATIKLKARSHNHQAIVTVENDGSPVAPQDKERIFGRFEQGDNKEGSGLGLAIVAEIMALHGGEVQLDARSDRTRFVLTFNVENVS